MRILAFYISVLLLVSSCERSPYKGYSLTDNGLSYKLHKIGDGDRLPQKDDYLTISYQVRDLKDTVHTKSRLMFKVRKINKKNPVIDAVSLLKQGDSISAILPPKLFYRDFVQSSVPKELKNEIEIKVGLKLEQLSTEEQFQKGKREFLDWLITNNVDDVDFIREQKAIKEFIENDPYQYSITPTGLFYTELKEGKGELVAYGDGVIIHYEGFTFDGKKFDSTYERKAWFDFIMGQEDQVIKGIEEGLFLMNKGSKYRFILPSYLAFKDKGTINGMVQPNEPVVYEVTLVRKSEK